MDPKWTRVLLILLLCQKITSAGPGKAEEGKEVSIKCKPQAEKGTMVVWFRVLDKSGMEFIASTSPSGTLKQAAPNFDKNFRVPDSQTLILRSFKRNDDSGVYSCASLVGGNRLQFGEVTRLQLDEATEEATKAPPVRSTTQTSTPTNTCLCKDKDKNKTGLSMFCAPLILGPLAGGCGLLLLLLIVTTLYCNKMRTRRCPHHHKRKPRMDALEKQMMTNRHV